MWKAMVIDDYDWVACSEKEHGVVGSVRHLLRKDVRKNDWQTTACGSTASSRGIWRANKSKDKCPTCSLRAAAQPGAVGVAYVTLSRGHGEVRGMWQERTDGALFFVFQSPFKGTLSAPADYVHKFTAETSE